MNRFLRKLGLFPIIFILTACHSRNNNAWLKQLQGKVNNLQDSLRIMKNEYRPGLGNLMTSIELHHSNLWFAGLNSNWTLAYFELGKIRSVIGEAEDLEINRPEIKELPIILPSLDSLSDAIALKNKSQFKRDFILLTNTCNNCHNEVNFPFENVVIPISPYFSNQDFKVQTK
ncbi:MAG TPA: hypothetical protein VNE41_05115 [Chitinophagaceae bacterium]|nr:hypothetical protein [Chitinophagaceae bacterium]